VLVSVVLVCFGELVWCRFWWGSVCGPGVGDLVGVSRQRHRRGRAGLLAAFGVQGELAAAHGFADPPDDTGALPVVPVPGELP